MKIQIDTKAKIIRIDETVKFDELIKVLNKLLPKEWKEYSLETNSVITWYNPIVWHYHYEPWVYPTFPVINPLPIMQPVIYDGGGTCQGGAIQSGVNFVYNVECVVN